MRFEEHSGLGKVRLACGVHVLRNAAPQCEAAVLLVPGAGGGWESPAGNLFGFLAHRMQEHSICTVQLKHARAADLAPCVGDVLQTMEQMRAEGVHRFVLIGWSFGGAVVLQAAAQSPDCVAVVTIATQSYGAEAAAELPLECSTLLLHGSADEVLPPQCSMQVFQQVPGDRKEIVLYPGAGHALTEVANQVHQKVYQFVFLKLHEAAAARAA